MLTTDVLLEQVGKKRGHFKEKSNRIAKLISEWESLQVKMEGFILRGNGNTYQARLAYAVLLMMETGIRTGNETSAEGWICDNRIVAKKDNPAKGIKTGDVIWQHPMYGQLVQTFGLTTLKHSHIKKVRNAVKIEFVGKKLVDQELSTKHPLLVQHCPKGPPDDLFLGITYYDLKKFVKKSVGNQYTPKDLRMTKVNLIFMEKWDGARKSFEQANTKTERKRLFKEVIENTASAIGHTPGVCRSAYMSQPLVAFLTNWSPDAIGANP